MATTRFPHLILAGLLAVLPAFGGEVADPVTAHVPVGAISVVRLPSLDRLDEGAVQLKGVIELFSDYEGPWGDLGKRPPSEMILAALNLGAGVTVDRTKPVYLAFVDNDDPLVVLPSGGGVAWEGEKTLKDGRVAVLRGASICVGRGVDIVAESRGATTTMLDGDIAVHVYLGELIEKKRQDIVDGFKTIEGGLKDTPFPLPPKAQDAIKALLGPVQEAVFSVESFGYALSLRDGQLVSEGLLKTKPRSALRTYIAGAGAPGENDLAMLLPDNLFMAADSVYTPNWGMHSMGDFMNQHMGPGSSDALTALMFPYDVLGDVWTGRSATGVQMSGFTGGGVVIIEVNDAAKAKELLAGFNPEAANAALKNLGIPLAISYEVGADSDGETALHRMAMSSDNAQLGMMMMGAQSYYAVEGGYVVSASGLSAGPMIKAALQRIREGTRAENPHLKAMNVLGKKRNMGLSINLGSLKPIAQMIGFQVPQALPYINAVPDNFYLSTAVTLGNGDIAWRGDWPLAEMTEITKKVAEIALEKKAKEELEEDFD